MKITMNKAAALGAMATLLLSAPGLAFGQDGSSIKGMITSHEGSTIVVRGTGGDTTVSLTGGTKIRGTSGSLKIRGEDHPPSDLIRGLAVEVTTDQSGGQATATEITFKNSDLKTARQIAAGLVTTDANVAENSDRIDNVGELVARGRTKVFFKTGSATLSDEGKQDLKSIAAQAKTIKGYRLAVVGRADTTGNASANQRLSEARAAAVTSYLLQSCGVLPGRILPTAALGSAEIAQDLDPPKTLAEARRVTVTIAVSKSSSS